MEQKPLYKPDLQDGPAVPSVAHQRPDQTQTAPPKTSEKQSVKTQLIMLRLSDALFRQRAPPRPELSHSRNVQRMKAVDAVSVWLAV
jgi:hypothetical protein